MTGLRGQEKETYMSLKNGVQVLGLHFKNPIVVASTDIARTAEQFRTFAESGVGAIITKSVTDAPALQDAGIARIHIADMHQKPVRGEGYPDQYYFFSRGGSMLSMEAFSRKAPELLAIGKENGVVVIGSIAASNVENWVKTSFLSDVQKILVTLTTSVMAVVKSITNFIIGLVASIYILWSKDTFQAQAKKMVVAACKPEAANHLLDLGSSINRIFSGFIIGKIIDSAIIGVLCYICMTLMKMPYTALIATIVGVTNVIPVFGPFIGAVPSALIILLVDPLQAFYFIIFIIVLQQVDGNVIGPKILGNTVGISGFWVLISITIAAGIFGFAGMLLGVPVFAVIYLIISDIVNSALRKKQKTTVTDEYYDIREVADLDRKAEAARQAAAEVADTPTEEPKSV